MNVGTIRGRHPLPVDKYLVEREVAPGDDAYNAALEAAFEHGHSLPVASTVKLYYTGLTEATIGALQGYEAAKTNVKLFRFDADQRMYVELPTRGPRFRRCPFLYLGETHATREGDNHCAVCGEV